MYTELEYAEMAHRANEQGKILIVANGDLLLQDPPAPDPETLNAQRHAAILARLKELDAESVRPLRAIARGEAVQDDTDKLAALDAEAQALREELAGLPE